MLRNLDRPYWLVRSYPNSLPLPPFNSSLLPAKRKQFPPLHPTLTLPAPSFLAECTGSSAGWVSRRHAPWASPHQPSADPRHLPTRARAPLLKLFPWPPASMRPATRVGWLTAAKNDWLQGPSLICWVIAENSLFEAEDTAFSTCFLMLMNVAPSPAQSLPCLLPCSFSSLFPILSPLSNHAASCSCDLTLKIPHCRDSASPGLSWIWRHVLGVSLGLCVWGLSAAKTQWQPQGDSWLYILIKFSCSILYVWSLPGPWPNGLTNYLCRAVNVAEACHCC